MYVCLCNGVTESTIHKAIADGNNSVKQLCTDLGMAKQCGKCIHEVIAITKESITKNTSK